MSEKGSILTSEYSHQKASIINFWLCKLVDHPLLFYAKYWLPLMLKSKEIKLKNYVDMSASMIC